MLVLIAIICDSVVYETVPVKLEKRSAKFLDTPTFAISSGIMTPGVVSHSFPDLGLLSLLGKEEKERERETERPRENGDLFQN